MLERERNSRFRLYLVHDIGGNQIFLVGNGFYRIVKIRITRSGSNIQGLCRWSSEELQFTGNRPIVISGILPFRRRFSYFYIIHKTCTQLDGRPHYIRCFISAYGKRAEILRSSYQRFCSYCPELNPVCRTSILKLFIFRATYHCCCG